MESHSQLVLRCCWLVLLLLKAMQQGSEALQCDMRRLSEGPVSISVTSTVFESALELSCSSSITPLINNQYLKWTEMGKELSDAFDINTSSSTINATANATINNYGVYTCRCYNNFSVADLKYIYYNDQEYRHHCSEPVSITVLPTGLATVVSHTVGKNSLAVINCSNETSKLYDATNGITDGAAIGLPFSILIDSPSKQGKYVCIDPNQELKEIHYITIQGYEPPMFLIPSMHSSGKTEISASVGVVPVCAVYSSIPVVSMRFCVIISGIPVSIADGFDSIGPSEMGLYSMSISGSSLHNLMHYAKSCQIKTVWDTIETSYYTNYEEETPFIPNVCLWVTIDPLVKNITLGESFTVECVVYTLVSSLEGSTVKLFHIDTMGNERFIPINSTKDDQNHDTYRYYATVNEASGKDFGEYTCRFRFDEYNLERNDSLRVYGYENDAFIPLMITSSIPFPSSIATPTTTITSSHSTLETPNNIFGMSTILNVSPRTALGTSATSSPNHTPTSRRGSSLSQDDSLVVVYAVIGTTVIFVSVSAVILILALCFMRKRSESVIVTPKALPKATENEYVTLS